MRPHRRPLLLLAAEPAFRATVLAAAGRDFVLHPVGSWEELASRLSASPLGTVVLADLCAGSCTARAPAARLRDLLREFPWATVVAVVDGARNTPAELLTLGEWGVAEVVSRGDDAEGIACVLREVRGRPLQCMVSDCLGAGTDERIRRIVAAAVDVASLGGRGSDLARVLHVSTRTLLRWCSQAGLPPPRHLLAWVRVLFAARMLDDRRRSVECVARACGYASGAGLGRAVREFLGVSTRALRTGGAMAIAERAFRSALGVRRAPGGRREDEPGERG